MAKAVAWWARVTTIALEMALPGLVGYWADQQLGTKMLLLVLGVIFGLTVGMWDLVRLAKASGGEERPRPTERNESLDKDSQEQ